MIQWVFMTASPGWVDDSSWRNEYCGCGCGCTALPIGQCPRQHSRTKNAAASLVILVALNAKQNSIAGEGLCEPSYMIALNEIKGLEEKVCRGPKLRVMAAWGIFVSEVPCL